MLRLNTTSGKGRRNHEAFKTRHEVNFLKGGIDIQQDENRYLIIASVALGFWNL